MILRFWSVSRWAGIGFGLRQRSGQELRPTQHGTDNERSLEQVVKLCTTLGGNGFTFSICMKIHDVFDFELESTKPQNQYVKQKRRRSPSYYKSQAKRTLLKKKSNMAVSQDRYKSCSLDISPNSDKAKLGLREISEAESKSDSRGSGSDNDTSDSVTPGSRRGYRRPWTESSIRGMAPGHKKRDQGTAFPQTQLRQSLLGAWAFRCLLPEIQWIQAAWFASVVFWQFSILTQVLYWLTDKNWPQTMHYKTCITITSN